MVAKTLTLASLLLIPTLSFCRHLTAMDCRVFVDFVYFNLVDLQKQG